MDFFSEKLGLKTISCQSIADSRQHGSAHKQ